MIGKIHLASPWIVNHSVARRRETMNFLLASAPSSSLFFHGCITERFNRLGASRRLLPWKVRFRMKCYKDFLSYVKPVRLLATTEPNICSETWSDQAIMAPMNQSSMKIKIRTSNKFGSGLTDSNAGVILCLIDVNGDSVLQRIPSILSSDCGKDETPLFQRASTDEITFEGPQLQRIEALWLAVESGSWRVNGATLTIISRSKLVTEEDGERSIQISGFQYEFDTEDDVLIGEESEVSLLELKPSEANEICGVDILKRQSFSRHEAGVSNEESMKEYSELKISLLIYDALLISAGTLVANFLVDESTASAFFLGGLCGFSYLLLIQKSVDNMAASTSVKNSVGLPGIALATVLVSLLAKNSINDLLPVFTIHEVAAGLMGFLASKVAVVIAALKPIKK